MDHLDLPSAYLEAGPSAEELNRTLLSNLPQSTLIQADITSEDKSSTEPVRVTRKDNSNQVGAVISKIEDIFESFADCILEQRKELVIELKSRSKPRVKLDHEEAEKAKAEEDEEVQMGRRTTRITFPSRNQREAWKFTALLRILELSHEALVTGIVTTKRSDIYYRGPEIFMKQAVVDRYVDDIAYTFGVGRDALNIVAAAKGLVAGSLLLTRKDTSFINFTLEAQGILIPNPNDIETIQFLDVKWILVIEKEATFRTLASNQYWNHSQAGRGILITAKGYPDIQTRQFLHLLSVHHPTIPVHALVDFDPDGIGIFSTYKHGSASLSHENDLAVPSMKWLGVRSCDFLRNEIDGRGLLRLSERDRRIAVRMLEREGEEAQRRELQVMLLLGVKAEIQILGNGERLGEWLDGRLIG
ncbi:related to MEIOTIC RECOMBINATION PROTEIN REC12 [Rhynchosporium secalis]|uniref:DNA topoisomerase (ATP-hydrolyzing) n=1 Tax=Rhynchosporium secalis TaxID=38038 RepID=A0A1E1MNP9_RHYSE|nr:related to MEIOTIC RECOMBINATION PROTEIN REC12 [Rhynchosporium secalis]